MSRLHQPKAGFWVRLSVAILYPLDGVLFRIRFRHLDRVPPPADGAVIIAMNHVSMLDTVLMARLVWQSGRVPRFLVKSGAFHTFGLGRVMKGAKQIPVYRGTENAADSLKDAVAALEQGEAVVIYPEGTVTSDPEQWPMQAKTGIARLVLLVAEHPGRAGRAVGRAAASVRAVVAQAEPPDLHRVGRPTARPVALRRTRAER